MQKILIGKREVVGFGTAGEATYMDLVMNPFPAIRFVAICYFGQLQFTYAIQNVYLPS